MPQTSEDSSDKRSLVNEIARVSDVDLLLDYNYLIISIGLAVIFAISMDFTNILPVFFNVSFSNGNFDNENFNFRKTWGWKLKMQSTRCT